MNKNGENLVEFEFNGNLHMRVFTNESNLEHFRIFDIKLPPNLYRSWDNWNCILYSTQYGLIIGNSRYYYSNSQSHYSKHYYLLHKSTNKWVKLTISTNDAIISI